VPSAPSPSSGGEGSALPGDSGSTGSTSGSASGSAGSGSADGTARRRDGTAETGVPAQTPAERRAQVDGKLDSTLGTFDEQIRREQQRTAEERDRRAADRAAGNAGSSGEGGGSAAGGEGSGRSGDRDRSGDLRSEGVQGKSPGDPSGSGANAGGTALPQGGGGAAANPIPSGEDDDIVARRLRKAAEAETDPELKEKLWKEYRDYKENTKGGR
jgi:hypothetical protein